MSEIVNNAPEITGAIKEQQVNTYTEGDQSLSQIIALSDGGYVVTWRSAGQDGSGLGVYLQQYNSSGAKVGAEQQVNSYTQGDQVLSQITALSDGGYIVTWTSTGEDSSSYSSAGVYLQRFNSSGAKVDLEQQINSYIQGDQYAEAITALSNGGYVVTWRSNGQDNSADGINSGGVYLQQYDSSGVKVGLEQQVNSYTKGQQFGSQITALNDGGYVVTWISYGQDTTYAQDGGDKGGIYLQRFNSSGVKVEGEQQVNSYNPGNQILPKIMALKDGGYVVTWQSDPHGVTQDHSGYGLYLQQFNSSGEKVGVEQQVNSYTEGHQVNQQITALNNGGYVVTWSSMRQADGASTGVYLQQFNSSGAKVGVEQQVDNLGTATQITALSDGGYVVTCQSYDLNSSHRGIYLQRFNSNGAKVGIEQQVNSYTGAQLNPQITALKDGGYVVNWTSGGQDGDGSGYGVYLQQFDSNGKKVGESVTSGMVVAVTLQDIRITNGQIEASDIDGDTLSYTVSTNPSHGTLSVDATTGKWSYTAAKGYMGKDSAIIRVSDGKGGNVEETLNFTLVVSSPSITSTSMSLAEDTPLNSLLSVNNPVGGALSYEIVNTSTHGTFTLNADGSYKYMPSSDYNGTDSVVLKVTNEYGLSTTQTLGLTITPIDDAPEITIVPTKEQQVNSTTQNHQLAPKIITLKNGDYVVTWSSMGLDGSASGMYLQRYSSSGVKIGSEQKINNAGIVAQLTALNDGGYVITSWLSSGQDGSGYGVYLQQYNSSGTKVGIDQRVNSYTQGDQYAEDTTVLSNGGYVVTWRSNGQDGSGNGVYLQQFNNSGAKVGMEQRVNSYTTGEQLGSKITALKDGSYVVTWSSDGQDGSGNGVYMQQYNSSGVKVGAEQRINTYTSNYQGSSKITTLNDGGYVVTWLSYGQDGSGYGVYLQQFNSSGTKVGVEQRVNSYTSSYQGQQQIIALQDGGYVITWQSDGQDGSGYGIYLQQYNSSGAKVGVEQRVNTYTENSQYVFSSTVLKDGGYVVTWQSDGQDGSSSGVYLQQYNSSGAKIGDEQQVNTYTLGLQGGPQITALNDGGYVVTWQSNGQDGSGYGVYMQQYNSLGKKEVDPTQTFSAYSGQSTTGDFNYIVDRDGDALTYTGSATNGVFSVDEAGKWSYTPNSTFKGTEKVEITIDDGHGGVLKQMLTFNVSTMTTPLVLDLNHNAITSIALADSIAYFDYDGDGNREHTAWLEKGDAQLVVDVNHDGKITTGSELFGEHTKLPNGSLAKDGYSALAQYDTNNDRVIDSQDAAFGNLLLWNDANQNGKSEEGELSNLQKNNVKAIYLDKSNGITFEQSNENGNLILNETSFSGANGSSIIRDVGFIYDATDTITNNDMLDKEHYGAFLSGGDGNDTYLYTVGDGNITINDNGNGDDTIVFGEGIEKKDITFLMESDNLTINCKEQNSIVVLGQNNDQGMVEKIKLSDGSFMTSNDVEHIIQQMSAYAVDKGISLTSNSDIQNNQALMQIVSSGWHNA